MMNGKNVFKNFSYSFISNFISLLLGVIATLVFPKFLDVADYGYYQLYILYTGYLIISSFGLSDGVQLEIAGTDYSNIDKKKYNSIFWLSTIIQLLLYSVFLMITPFMHNENKQIIIIFICLVGMFTFSRYYLKSILQTTNRLKKYAVIEITERLISIVVSLIFLFLGCKNFVIIILIDVIGRFISFIIALYFCRDLVFKWPKINKDTFKDIMIFTSSGFLILFAMQTSNIVIGLNKFGIEHLWGIEQFGKISLSIALANMVLRCVNSFSVVMFPTLRTVEENKLPSIYIFVNKILLMLILICMIFFKPLCILVSNWLPQYREGLNYAILLLPLCIWECSYSLLINTYLKTFHKEKIIGIINFISIFVSIILFFIGIVSLKNLDIAIIGIFISLASRCIIGEIYLSKKMKINYFNSIFSKILFSVMYIICFYYNLTIYSIILFILLVFGYFILNIKYLKKFTSSLNKKIINNL